LIPSCHLPLRSQPRRRRTRNPLRQAHPARPTAREAPRRRELQPARQPARRPDPTARAADRGAALAPPQQRIPASQAAAPRTAARAQLAVQPRARSPRTPPQARSRSRTPRRPLRRNPPQARSLAPKPLQARRATPTDPVSSRRWRSHKRKPRTASVPSQQQRLKKSPAARSLPKRRRASPPMSRPRLSDSWRNRSPR